MIKPIDNTYYQSLKIVSETGLKYKVDNIIVYDGY